MADGTCAGSGSGLTGTTGQLAYFSGTDTAVGTSTIFIDTASRVGIGTSTPLNKLTIFDSSKSALEFSGGATRGSFTMGFDVTNNRFAIASSTALGTTDRLVIDPNGNVGIASSTPFARLSLQGSDTSATTKGLIITDSNMAELLTVFNDGLTQLKNLLVTASSTIGGGTQTTGLTISGGATTTGLLHVQGTGTSTVSNGLSVGPFNAWTSTITNLIVNNTSTSTFAGGVNFSALNVTSASASSTFANG